MTARAATIDDLPPRADELLKRALWICGQVPRLHEYSEQIGVASHVTDIGNCATTLACQTIMEAADRLNHDLAQYLAALHPAPTPATVLRFKKQKPLRNHGSKN